MNMHEVQKRFMMQEGSQYKLYRGARGCHYRNAPICLLASLAASFEINVPGVGIRATTDNHLEERRQLHSIAPDPLFQSTTYRPSEQRKQLTSIGPVYTIVID